METKTSKFHAGIYFSFALIILALIYQVSQVTSLWEVCYFLTMFTVANVVGWFSVFFVEYYRKTQLTTLEVRATLISIYVLGALAVIFKTDSGWFCAQILMYEFVIAACVASCFALYWAIMTNKKITTAVGNLVDKIDFNTPCGRFKDILALPFDIIDRKIKSLFF